MKAAAIALVALILAWPLTAQAEGGSMNFGGKTEKMTFICDTPECQCAGTARLGQAERAVWICSAILNDPASKDPQRATAFINRAAARILQRRYDDAVADSTQGLALEVSLNEPFAIADAYVTRGDSYLQMKDDVDADDDYTAAIAAESQNPKLFVSRGMAYLLQGKINLALADFQTAIDRAGPQKIPMGVVMMDVTFTGSDGYWGRGAVYFLAGQYDQAASDFSKTISLEPDGGLGAIWLHYARERQGRDDSAELAANATALDAAGRDAAIAKLFQGKASAQDVANIGSGPAGTSGVCEGELALAEWSYFTRHDLAAAKAHYQTVASSCPRSLDVVAAQAMLQTIH